MTLLPALLALGLAAAPSREAQALSLYKKGNFEKACPLYEALAVEKATDSAAWSDLGLCEFRRKKVIEGRHATLLALRYGDAKVRKSAAWNLALNAPLALDLGKVCCEVTCVALPADLELGCGAQADVCSQTDGNMGFGWGDWVEERWLAIDVTGGGADAGTAWLEAPLEAPHDVASGMLVVLSESSLTFRRDGSIADDTTTCSLVEVDGCASRAFFQCVTTRQTNAKKNVLTNRIVEVAISKAKSMPTILAPRTIEKVNRH